MVRDCIRRGSRWLSWICFSFFFWVRMREVKLEAWLERWMRTFVRMARRASGVGVVACGDGVDG